MSRNMTSAQMRINDAILHRKYAASKPPNATPSITHGNACMREPYTGPKFSNARPEGDDHLAITSRGV